MKWVSFIPASLRRTVIRAAQMDLEPVYLSGETGSGKSAIARWIHQNSPRSARPFITASPGDSLFAKAAAAEEGTLVLLDIDQYSGAERSTLVRLIRSRSLIDPAHPELRTLVRARLIATGTLPIDEFSAFDLVFKDFRVHLPSLSERGVEFADIVASLLEEMAHELRRDHVREISPDALAILAAHPWRANLRELRNALRYGILKTRGARIETDHLPRMDDPALIGTREEFAVIERSL